MASVKGPLVSSLSLSERITQQEAVASLLSLADEDLARMVVTPTDRRHTAACVAVRQRSHSLLLKNAKRICGHLGHSGRRCLGPGCDQAFNAAMGELATRITGIKVSYAHIPGATFEECFYVNSADRKPRTSRPSSATLRWMGRVQNHRELSLAAAIGSELKTQGRFSDVRRRWNTDRGLKARINLPDHIFIELQSALDQSLRAVSAPIAAMIDDSAEGRSIKGWADRVYEDACDTAAYGVLGPDRLRIARAVGLPLVENVVDGLGYVALDVMLSVLFDAADSYLQDQYFTPAYAVTRPTADMEYVSLGDNPSRRVLGSDFESYGADHGA